MKLYLIRHAQSANNAIFSGNEHEGGRTPDPEITNIGHEQSKRLAQFLTTVGNEPRQHPYALNESANFNLTHIYCSLMTRSILTASYIAQSCALTLEARDDVFERKGLYEIGSNGEEVGVSGPGRSYFENRFPELMLPRWIGEKGWWNRPMENDEQFIQRTKTSINKIIEEHRLMEANVAVIVHGDYIDQCINAILGVQRKPQNYASHWEANWVSHNTSVTRIDIEDHSSNIIYLNRIDHLTPELITW
ncbi:MAG: hypothetical protein GKR95_13095 [Gammaproteobacteria bacterium]|nr:hypothetical protein [Gammaproteobacteria bacterium]NKB63005.1 hypothetical protein [Gammaproteobacteria bacterium]